MKLATALALLAAAPSGAAGADPPGTAPAIPARPAAHAIAPIDAPPLAPASAAGGLRTRIYLAVRGGVYRPSRDAGFDERSLDLELTFGVPLTRHIALEGGVGRYASGMPRRFIQMTALPDTPAGTLEQHLSVIPITAGVRATAHAARFAFSFLAGGGVHVATVETIEEFPFAGSSRATSRDDRAFGVHVGGGLALAITERIRVGIEIVRTFVSAVSIDESPLTARSDELELDGFRGGATLAYRM